MIKKRIFSAHSDLRTGFFCKLFFVSGVIFLVVYLIGTFLPPVHLNSTLLGTILAFSILFLGGSALLFFFFCQFRKLSEIAEEVEQDETLMDDEDQSDKQT